MALGAPIASRMVGFGEAGRKRGRPERGGEEVDSFIDNICCFLISAELLGGCDHLDALYLYSC